MTNKKPFDLQGIHHVAVQARDWDQSLALYCDVLGMEIVSWVPTKQRKIALLAAGNGNYIELFAPQADTPSPESAAVNDPLTHFSLRVSDVAAAVEHVRAAGYVVTVEPVTLEGPAFHATLAFFDGPNGESIELQQWMGIDGAV